MDAKIQLKKDFEMQVKKDAKIQAAKLSGGFDSGNY